MTIGQLEKEIFFWLKKNNPDLSLAQLEKEAELEIPPQPEMGDLSLPCFILAKPLKKAPAQIAAELAQAEELFKKNFPLIERVRNVGPYLNFFVNKKLFFQQVLNPLLQNKKMNLVDQPGKGKKILLEFSSPNTNKPQHLGHLRNNFLGISLTSLFEQFGYRVIKTNLINDRGIHICKSMLAYQKWGEGKTPYSEGKKGDHFVGDYYVLFNKKVEDDPQLLTEAQKMLKQWEEGDKEVRALWKKMTQWALEGLKETYRQLGVSFDRWYFESEFYNSGKQIVEEALKKGLCYRREDGAIEIDLTADRLDKKVLLRPDGTSVYITQDIGLALLKHRQFKPDQMIYLAGSEQIYHFNVLFKILKIFGFAWANSCSHLSYGMISLPEGKMKSREGTVVDGDDLLQELIDLARKEIIARQADLPEQEIEQRAKIIAQGALKFHLLKFTPQQDIVFQPKESISFQGNTGPYLQYTYARIQSILQKAGRLPRVTEENWAELGELEEMELAKRLFVLPQILAKAVRFYNPAQLANYLLELAQTFNTFYHQHPVLQADNDVRKNARLLLIQAVAQTLRRGLNLLGIEVLDKM